MEPELISKPRAPRRRVTKAPLTAENTTSPSSHLLSAKYTYIIAFVLILLFFILASREVLSVRRTTPQTPQQVQTEVARINRIIDLPQGEIPSFAVVTDLTKLPHQPFFAHAKVGDEVLMYNTAQKAYLYDPSSNMIIEVATLNNSKK